MHCASTDNCAGFAMILEVSKDMPLPSPPSSMQPRLPAAALPPPVTGNMMLQTSHMFQEPPAMQQSQPEGQPDAASTNNGRRKRKPAATTDGYVMVSGGERPQHKLLPADWSRS